MAAEPLDQAALDRRWRRWAFTVVVGAILTGAILGFLVLSQFQHRNAGVTWWVAICRAAGVSPGSPAYRQPVWPDLIEYGFQDMRQDGRRQ